MVFIRLIQFLSGNVAEWFFRFVCLIQYLTSCESPKTHHGVTETLRKTKKTPRLCVFVVQKIFHMFTSRLTQEFYYSF